MAEKLGNLSSSLGDRCLRSFLLIGCWGVNTFQEPSVSSFNLSMPFHEFEHKIVQMRRKVTGPFSIGWLVTLECNMLMSIYLFD